MAEINLTQLEADLLLSLEKIKIDETEYTDPVLGGNLIIPLTSVDRREQFYLDIWKGKIDLNKGKYQNRGRSIIILARLDYGGQPHRNPDGIEIASPHVHIYREGYGDKWAYELPYCGIENSTNMDKLFADFLKFCNVTKPPKINKTLFS